ncbi:PREDICTED: holotricin-3-like [Ceratosolen solmsi marchali]|uniref:Holotricin-3-like n=1 Tax=Ceratosolen solmsi marchali TaxID=326594 RepID=A0AAJ6YG49_9HYME|nr:PREDICTED: holotricin-3-like [Ceratosolen solmsi marchali]
MKILLNLIIFLACIIFVHGVGTDGAGPSKVKSGHGHPKGHPKGPGHAGKGGGKGSGHAGKVC